MASTVTEEAALEQEGAARSASHVPLIGAAAIAASIGTQLMLLGMICFGPLPRSKKILAELTQNIQYQYLPERDLLVYAVGIVLSLIFAAVLGFVWHRLGQRGAEPGRSNSEAWGWLQVVAAAIGLAVFLALLKFVSPLNPHSNRSVPHAKGLFELSLPAASLLLLAFLDLRYHLAQRLSSWVRWGATGLLALSLSIQVALLYVTLLMSGRHHFVLSVRWLPWLAAPVALAIAMKWWRQRSDEHQQSFRTERSEDRGWVFDLVLAGLSSFTFACLFLARARFGEEATLAGSSILLFVLLSPAFAALICFLIDPLVRKAAPSRSFLLFQMAILLLVVLVVFISPANWASLSGHSLINDHLHHLNYFVVGPALAFEHGGAFATDFYSQYGVGWPFLMAMIRHVVPTTYANATGMGVIFACFYYCALNLFLRALLRDPVWAAAGTLVAITFQLFSGIAPGDTMWMFPSSTVLRHPTDILWFATLLAHYRTGRPRWLWAAGATCGLACLFDLDTGLYMPPVAVLYLLLRAVMSSPDRGRTFVIGLVPYSISAVSVFLIGLAVASRGTLLRAAFWDGYLAGLHNQAFFGLGLLPVASVDGFGLAVFALIFFIYLFTIGWGSMRAIQQRASEQDVLTACIAAYGLGLLLLFVGRSHPFNLFHPGIPLVVVCVCLLHRIQRHVRSATIPWGALVMALIVMATKPEFLVYPNVFVTTFIQEPLDGIVIREKPPDLRVPVSLAGEVASIRAVASSVRRLSGGDKTVVVLDDLDTLFYCLADIAPWSGQTSLFHSIFTKSALAAREKELLHRRPKWAVIRAADAAPAEWVFNDVWSGFHETLPRAYHLDHRIGIYEFWRLGVGSGNINTQPAYHQLP